MGNRAAEEMRVAGARSLIDGQEQRPGSSWAEEAELCFKAMQGAASKNQCDGCRSGAPVNAWGNHVYADGSRIGCTKERYE